MQVRYLGNRNEYTHGKRMAEIGCEPEEDNVKVAICDLMIKRGWNIDYCVEGWAGCLVEDRTEYNYFMEDWKECKKEYKERM